MGFFKKPFKTSGLPKQSSEPSYLWGKNRPVSLMNFALETVSMGIIVKIHELKPPFSGSMFTDHTDPWLMLVPTTVSNHNSHNTFMANP